MKGRRTSWFAPDSSVVFDETALAARSQGCRRPYPLHGDVEAGRARAGAVIGAVDADRGGGPGAGAGGPLDGRRPRRVPDGHGVAVDRDRGVGLVDDQAPERDPVAAGGEGPAVPQGRFERGVVDGDGGNGPAGAEDLRAVGPDDGV